MYLSSCESVDIRIDIVKYEEGVFIVVRIVKKGISITNFFLCKRTQHCWPTTPKINECYMMSPFVHPVAYCCVLLGVVAQNLKPVKLLATCKRTQQPPTLLGQPCLELLRPFVRSFRLCSVKSVLQVELIGYSLF